MKLRIIGGQDKGRNLKGKTHPSLRPTAQKIKEALFNILHPLENHRFLDLFAGTGQVGIEALSRGAGFVSFVERSRTMVERIESNVGNYKNVQIIQGDAFKYVKASKDDPYDIIFADPPYFLSMYEKLFECLALSEIFSHNTQLILEHHRSVPLPEKFESWERQDERIYGDTFLSFYQPIEKD